MRVGPAYHAILPNYSAKPSPATDMRPQDRPLPAGTRNAATYPASALWPMPLARRVQDNGVLDRLLHSVCTLRPEPLRGERGAGVCCRCGGALVTPVSAWRGFCCGTDYAECLRRQKVLGTNDA